MTDLPVFKDTLKKFNSIKYKKCSPEGIKLYVGLNDFAFHKQRFLI